MMLPVFKSVVAMALLSVVADKATAYPAGAGACFAGTAAVGGSHVSSDVNSTTGQLSDGGIELAIKGAPLDPSLLSQFMQGTVYTWTLSNVDDSAPDFRGFLVRLEGSDADLSAALTSSDGLVQDAAVCPPDNVAGMTHNSADPKRQVSGELIFDFASQDVTVDVTVVVENRAGRSAYFYSQYKLAVEATSSPTGSPSESPSMQPSTQPSNGPTQQPTTSFPSMVPTTSPSQSPSELPSVAPSSKPTSLPSLSPTVSPSESPTDENTIETVAITFQPSQSPTNSAGPQQTEAPTASTVTSSPPTNPPTPATPAPQLATPAPQQPAPIPSPTPPPSDQATPASDAPPTLAPSTAPTESDEGDFFDKVRLDNATAVPTGDGSLMGSMNGTADGSVDGSFFDTFDGSMAVTVEPPEEEETESTTSLSITIFRAPTESTTSLSVAIDRGFDLP